jgi:hypothetical protein
MLAAMIRKWTMPREFKFPPAQWPDEQKTIDAALHQIHELVLETDVNPSQAESNEFSLQFWQDKTRRTLDRYFMKVRLARATEMAQQGRYLTARSLLSLDGHLPQHSGELDLMARIAAHQGFYEEARSLWETALKRDVENELCLRALKVIPTSGQIRRKLWMAYVSVALIFLAATGIAVYLLYPTSPKTAQVNTPARPGQIQKAPSVAHSAPVIPPKTKPAVPQPRK